MTLTRTTPAERASRHPCARCGHVGPFRLRWPEGHLCNRCITRAVQTYGTCPRCTSERLLPGLDYDTGEPICRDCAGIPRRFDCRRCGTETRLYYRWVCAPCRLHDLARERLTAPDGHVPTHLEPLVTALSTGIKSTPESRMNWLNNPATRRLLADLAAGNLPLTHAALDAHPPRQVAYLRALLVATDLLPTVDTALHGFQTWLHQRLADLADHPHERLLRLFGLWHQLPRMQTKAELAPLTPNARTYAQMAFKRAIDFCTWLDTHQHDPRHLDQATLDSYVTALTDAHQQALIGFLTWAMNSQRLPRLRLTRPRYRIGEALDQTRRLDLLRDLLDHDDAPLGPRVAACLLLLYGQPITRIRTLTLDDVATDDTGHTALNFGDPATPVPQPFADLLLRLAAQRLAADGDRWLFAGRRYDQPVSYASLTRHLRQLGIPLRQARTAALRELVLDVPAPVVAQALGFHHTTTQRQHRNAGGTWNRYVAARKALPKTR